MTMPPLSLGTLYWGGGEGRGGGLYFWGRCALAGPYICATLFSADAVFGGRGGHSTMPSVRTLYWSVKGGGCRRLYHSLPGDAVL